MRNQFRRGFYTLRAFVGALEAFEARGHSKGRLLGTSAGAITAVFLAAGYTTQDMGDALDETTADGTPVFETFMGEPAPYSAEELEHSAMKAFLANVDVPLIPDFLERKMDAALVNFMANNPRFRNLFNFVERGGWFAADNFLVWLQKYLDQGEDNGKPRRYSKLSLAEMFEETGRELTLVAADTTDARILVLNRHTAPDCPVVRAARMSMSVPLLWEEVIWQAEWGAYRGRTITDHAIVDGGLLSNFPIELFISDQPQVTAVMGEKTSDDVLGFLIDESLTVENAPAPPGNGGDGLAIGDFQTVRRIHQLINAATQAHDKEVIDAFENLVVRLPARGYGTTEFKMDQARRQALIAAGRKVTAEYLDQPPQMPSFDIGVAPPSPEDIANVHAQRLLGE